MIVIIEGIDCVGKGTQIEKIEKEFERRGVAVHIVHYSNIRFNESETIELASHIRYREMFNFIAKCPENNVLILDRAHLGETVYSPIYRKYSGDFVFDYEKEFLEKNDLSVKMIVFSDDVDAVIARDKERNDGKSFSLDPAKKKAEIDAFKRAYEMSLLDKKLIELKGRDAETIWEKEVKPFIFGAM